MAHFKDNIVQGILYRVTRRLGEDGSFIPINGSPLSVRVVFDNRAELIDPDTETVVSTNQPRILVNLKDYPSGINKGDKFVLESAAFKVWSVQEDGQGGAIVLLHKVEL